MATLEVGMTVDLGAGEHDVRLDVHYDFTAGSSPILNPIDKADPGNPPEIDLLGAYANNMDYLPYLSAYQKEQLEQEILEHEEDAKFDRPEHDDHRRDD